MSYVVQGYTASECPNEQFYRAWLTVVG